MAARRAQRPIACSANERNYLRDGFLRAEARFHGLEASLQDALAEKQQAVGGANRADRFARKFPSFHSNDIDTAETRESAGSYPKRDDIATQSAQSADHRVIADTRELMGSG
jgi:hypothetical protein